jgi:hypothetical protein
MRTKQELRAWYAVRQLIREDLMLGRSTASIRSSIEGGVLTYHQAYLNNEAIQELIDEYCDETLHAMRLDLIQRHRALGREFKRSELPDYTEALLADDLLLLEDEDDE